jgi:RimJ/RimL family protein N-acetyltransferase
VHASESAEIRDIAPGLWIWRLDQPSWEPGFDWPPTVTSTVVESRGEVALLDPLAPPDGDPVWQRLDAAPPTLVVVLKPDHVRDVDRFVERYGCRAFGPALFWPTDVPRTELEPIDPDIELPGGLRTLDDGRRRLETPVWLPVQRALVFADGLTAPEGELQVWFSRHHVEAVLPALRRMLELPFEHVIVSHGEPVHDRAAFARALERPPWSEDEAAVLARAVPALGLAPRPVLRGEQVLLRPLEPHDVEPVAELQRQPSVARWWGEPDLSDLRAKTRGAPDEAVFAIEESGALAGLIQYYEENEPDFRHVGIDLFLGDEHQGRGLGTDAVRTLARYLIDERGHHRLTIDPAADNAAAIRCYEKVGFRCVGVMREYWRDPSGMWRDGVLLDLLAAELR